MIMKNQLVQIDDPHPQLLCRLLNRVSVSFPALDICGSQIRTFIFLKVFLNSKNYVKYQEEEGKELTFFFYQVREEVQILMQIYNLNEQI